MVKRRHAKYRWIVLTLEVIFLVGLLLASNNIVFGVWNPFSVPVKINLDGRNYHRSNLSPMTFSDSDIPEYPINAWVWTGKSLYTVEPKGTIIPTVIYLKLIDGKYQSYSLSGSN